MGKFLSIVIWEYARVVLTWTFLVSTLLAPILLLALIIGPTVFFNSSDEPVGPTVFFNSSDEPVRLALINFSANDVKNLKTIFTQKRYSELGSDLNLGAQNASLESDLVNVSLEFAQYGLQESAIEEARQKLNVQIANKEIEGYIIAPAGHVKDGVFKFFYRDENDVFLINRVKYALQKLTQKARAEALKITKKDLRYLNESIKFELLGIDETGSEKNTESNFGIALIIGVLIYVSLTIYGQSIVGKVLEEKETRLAEILFSSAGSFELIGGKVLGVGLACLSQFGIWVLPVVILDIYGIYQARLMGYNISLSEISGITLMYFFAFFILGFFIYASIFAFIGSIVTTTQEGAQFSFVPLILLVFGVYSIPSVIGEPNSTFAAIISNFPFFSPIVMPIRIMADKVPFWQIGLSLFITLACVLLCFFIVARVYRVSMLIYGKRPTIPEIWKWIWHI